MKSLLAKLPTQRGVGIYLGDLEIAISQVASTPLGLVETARSREPCAPQDREIVLDRLLRALLGQGKRPSTPIAVGLPAARFFFATRPLRAVGADASPEVLLQKALQSPTICVDEFNVDVIKSQWNKVPIASVAACRRKQLGEVLAILEHCGVRPFRVEPDSSALVRTAAQRHRPPRRAKTVLHVFLNDTQGLAVLAAAALPIAWRKFALPAGQEGPEIFSVQRTLQALGKHYGIEAPLDAFAVYGRSDLHAKLAEEAAAEETGNPLRCYDGPALDAAEIAFGLALGCLNQNQPAFDLSRALKPRASIREIFPWGELALEVALMICLGLLLAGRTSVLARAYEAVLVEKARHPCLASTAPAKLEKEKSELRERVDAVRRFLATRIIWTGYTHDLPGRLPTNAQLVSLQGLCELEYFGKREGAIKPKKSFVLRAMAPLGAGGAVPHEIDVFLNALRNHPLLKNDFPEVVLGDIKRFQVFAGSQPMASFSVVCLPGAKGTAAAPPAAEPGKKGAK
jgi:hypothetical protein